MSDNKNDSMLGHGIKGIDHIQESGPLVRLDKADLPDLDMLMLDVYAWCGREDILPEWFEPEEYTDERTGKKYVIGGDRPTSIPDAGWPSSNGEAIVGYFRKNPCVCGEEHSFDMDELDTDEAGNPIGSRARGAFLGVYFR